MILYHNARCGKSREALNILNKKGRKPEIREYLKEPLSENELKELLRVLGIKAEDLIRKSEKDFKENFKGKSLSEKQWIKAMIKYPKLIQRPILVHDGKAIIGRPPHLVLDLL